MTGLNFEEVETPTMEVVARSEVFSVKYTIWRTTKSHPDGAGDYGLSLTGTGSNGPHVPAAWFRYLRTEPRASHGVIWFGSRERCVEVANEIAAIRAETVKRGYHERQRKFLDGH